MNDVVCVLSQQNLELPLKQDDALGVFSKIAHHACLSDRFGFLNQFSPWNFVSTETLPDVSGFSESIDTLMLKRAAEVFNAADKPLYVAWSGGVDSTAMVTALSMLERPFNVIYTASSIDEYPEFYEYLKTLPFVTLICCSAIKLPETLSNASFEGTLVTGFPADQLFGSIVNQSLNVPFNSSWKDLVKVTTAVEQFEAAFSYYKLPIKTVSELTWFINFACKWNIVTHMLTSFYGLQYDSVINYFEPVYFQQWSISNFDSLHRYSQTDPKYYKIELKKFINKHFGKGSYIVDKGKTGSLAYAFRFEQQHTYKIDPWIAWLDTDNKVHMQHYGQSMPYSDAMYMQNAVLYKFLKTKRRVYG